MAHAFVSYVRENADQIDQLVLDLYKHGVDTWTDKHILPGERWKTVIHDAIKAGAAFLPCFSHESVARTRSYMYEEITVAIEMLREMPLDRKWFLPVLLAECDVPAYQIGAGQSLADLQWVKMFPNWDAGVTKIATVVKHALAYDQPSLPTSTAPRLPPLRTAPSEQVVDAWRSVWSTLFALQFAGEALFSQIDRVHIADYASRLDEAIKRVGECAFYFDKDDFEQLNALLLGALQFRSGKSTVYDALYEDDAFNRNRPYGWEHIDDTIRSNIKAFEEFCRIVSEIRDRYTIRTASSGQHLSTRQDRRHDKTVTTLEQAAARSKRKCAILRMAEGMVARGEISLESQCPRGHGKLRDWEGKPRCWTCGWPWRDLKATMD
jgi:hypothetical protein